MGYENDEPFVLYDSAVAEQTDTADMKQLAKKNNYTHETKSAAKQDVLDGGLPEQEPKDVSEKRAKLIFSLLRMNLVGKLLSEGWNYYGTGISHIQVFFTVMPDRRIRLDRAILSPHSNGRPEDAEEIVEALHKTFNSLQGHPDLDAVIGEDSAFSSDFDLVSGENGSKLDEELTLSLDRIDECILPGYKQMMLEEIAKNLPRHMSYSKLPYRVVVGKAGKIVSCALFVESEDEEEEEETKALIESTNYPPFPEGLGMEKATFVLDLANVRKIGKRGGPFAIVGREVGNIAPNRTLMLELIKSKWQPAPTNRTLGFTFDIVISNLGEVLYCECLDREWEEYQDEEDNLKALIESTLFPPLPEWFKGEWMRFRLCITSPRERPTKFVPRN